jgi:hypothetical protein
LESVPGKLMPVGTEFFLSYNYRVFRI